MSASVGASVRYRAMRLAADTFDGRETYWMHGPVLAPFVALAGPRYGRKSELGGARESYVSFEFPIGFAITPEGNSASLGFNLTLRDTLF